MNVEAVLHDLINAPDYEGQLVHVERVAGREARFGKPKTRLPYALETALRDLGIERLYSHQAAALDALAKGDNVVLVSGPASGKSLAYQLPILADLIEHPQSRSLLLFPAKALAYDQLRAFEQLTACVAGLQGTVGVLDGDTPPDARRRLRDHTRLILTNPDFLHAAILPNHSRWQALFENLRFVVLDELHVYTGLFGANMGNLFRRLWRVTEHYGREASCPSASRAPAPRPSAVRRHTPQVICCSATIANPLEFAERLVGRPMNLIADDGSPRGARTYILWNPPLVRDQGSHRRRSANIEAHRIAARLIANRLPTIIFSKARITAELIARSIREELLRMGSPLFDKVMPYRGGLLPEERRAIERRLFNGDLLAVSTTPALELGIDVGAFEACIIVGYPGRRASFFQQAGRAGRRDRDSLVVLVTVDTPINQWIAEHPEYLFGRPIETAVMDCDNPLVVSGHLRCAAAELPVAETETDRFGPHAVAALAVLQDRRKVKHLGGRWFHTAAETPQHELSLRAFSESNVLIVDADDENRVIGEVDVYDSQPIVHPHAIYFHLGESYEIERLDLERNMAFARKVEVDYYTQPLGGQDVDHVDRVLRERELPILPLGLPMDNERAAGPPPADLSIRNPQSTIQNPKPKVRLGEVTVYGRTSAYEKIRLYSLDAFEIHPLQLPVQQFETLAVWIEVAEDLVRDVFKRGLDAYSGLRGIGYAVRMMLPLFVCAETLDFSHSVGSRNTPWHTLFVFERHPRGLGFVEKAYETLEDILETVYQRIRDCRCTDGCPCCVGKPLRGTTVRNIERGEGSIPSRPAALSILEALLGKRAIELDAADVQLQPPAGVLRSNPAQKALPPNIERAIRRRLERQREAKVLHYVQPEPPVGYPAAEPPAALSQADVARRARHRAESVRALKKQSAARAKINPPGPELPETVAAAQPPEPLPPTGPRIPRAQAEDLRKQAMIASIARRKIRSKPEKTGEKDKAH